jgi:hypothetical protein
VFLNKTAMMNAIRKLIAHEDVVRQKMVDLQPRLKLGMLSPSRDVCLVSVTIQEFFSQK